MIPSEVTEDTVKELIYADEKLASELSGKTIKKLIIVHKNILTLFLINISLTRFEKVIAKTL